MGVFQKIQTDPEGISGGDLHVTRGVCRSSTRFRLPRLERFLELSADCSVDEMF
jgi:hypothetical protein